MFHAFVTLTGCGEDECYDYLYPETICGGFFDTFEEALRFYERLYVRPFGTIATYAHASHPDLVQIEAEYDIYEKVGDYWEPVGDVRWFVNEAIWWEDR